MSEGNPDLLEGIFRDEDESESSDSETPESTSDMILRATSTLTDASAFSNKWIRDGEKNFFFDSQTRRLICHNPNGSYMQYLGSGRFVAIDDPTAPPKEAPILEEQTMPVEVAPVALQQCWMTSVRRESLEVIDKSNAPKRQRTEQSVPSLSFDDLLEQADTRIDGFKTFINKWNLSNEEQTVRHFLKSDLLLVSYIVKRFNPTKALPKNALLKFTDSLSQFPQKWRIFSLIESGIVDSGEAETSIVPDSGLAVTSGTTSHGEDNVIELEETSEMRFQIVKMESDFYVINQSAGIVHVDGIRCTPSDGPVGPLVDGSVVVTPEHMLVVEIGEPEYLVKRRSPTPSAKIE